MSTSEYRDQLVKLGSSLFSRGFSVGGAGNISLLLPDGNVLATPTNSSLGRLDGDRLSVVSLEGSHISGDKATKELPMHLAVYKVKSECKAVVHLHSTYVTALSCTEDLDYNNALRPFTPYYVMKVGRLPVIPYYKPGAQELGDEAAKLAQEVNVFLMANHGVVVCGKSLIDAVNIAEELEETARLYFLLLSSGKSIHYLSEQETKELS